ncbi:hypothetical protein [Spirulina subsalsa]|uniref:hypothetical protein n=1 Tax=Spirulina subsalsa TaxID=54311 RepID=UPI000305249C|nr:hypothetical protein [Spirulina subsalsa]
MRDTLKLKIISFIQDSIKSYFAKRQLHKPVFHVLDHVFPHERRVHSVMNGLVTSMGTSFWEKLAKFLAQSNDFETITEPLLMPDPFPITMRNKLGELESLRKSRNSRDWVSTPECITILRDIAQTLDLKRLNFIKPPSGHGVDVY